MQPRNRPLSVATLLFGTLSLALYALLTFVPSAVQTRAVAGSLAATATPAPDLQIAGVTVTPPNPGPGATGDIAIVIKNGGTAPVAGFYLYLYVDPAEEPPVATTPYTARTFFGVTLEPNGVFVWTRTGHAFTGAPKLSVWVDPPWENRVKESNEANNLYPHRNATITALHPAVSAAGSTLTITVAATRSHLLNGLTKADLGAGITVATVNVLSATHAILAVTIAPTATHGTRPLSLATGAEVITKSAAFTVTAPVTPPTPRITAITPDHAYPGAALTVTIAAAATHFTTGYTTVDFGPGITVTAVSVLSPTQVVATIAILPAATLGPRLVTLQTVAEIITKTNGFQVNPPPSHAHLTVDPPVATLVISEPYTLAIHLAPGTGSITQVQVAGKVDPAYLHLTKVSSAALPSATLAFDPDNGAFQMTSMTMRAALTETVTALTLVVEPRQVTTAQATLVELNTGTSLTGTLLTGPAGAITYTAQAGQYQIVARSGRADLQGQVDLQGRPLLPDANWAIPVAVELLPMGGRSLAQQFYRQLDARGAFTIENLTSGDYAIRVKGNHTLANRVENVSLQPGANDIYLGTLLEGDVETNLTNNQIVVADFSLLSGAFQRCRQDVGFLPNADLNEDGCITVEDSILVYANFNHQGDLVYDHRAGIPAPLPMPEALAHLAFAPSTQVITVGESSFLPLYVDPKTGDPILGAAIGLRFDPALVEVTGVKLNGQLPYLLLPVINNQAGIVHINIQALPGATGITARTELAAFQVKLKQRTGGAYFDPIRQGRHATHLVGYQGNLLADVTGVSLISSDYTPPAHRLLLPLVVRP